MIKFPCPEAARQNRWTHQVNWEGLNGPDVWVPCFSRHTTQAHAEHVADNLRADPINRNVRVNPIPQTEERNNDQS